MQVHRCIPRVEHQDRRWHLAARSRELLGHDPNEASQADGVLVEEGHDAQTKTLLCLHTTMSLRLHSQLGLLHLNNL